MELQWEILCLGKPFYRKRAPSLIRSRRSDQGEQGIYHVMVFGDGGFADSYAPCTGRKDTEPTHNGTTRKISRSKGVVLKHGGYGSGLAAIVRGASSCRPMGYRTQNAQRFQRMGGFAPTQPRTQHDNARGVAAGSWQICGKSEQKGTNGSAWLWRELLALWVETANTVLLETQRSDAYLKSQREILKTSTDLRLAQQEIAAFYSETFGYPTRAELDDVHRTVTELRRELRALQRANREAPKHSNSETTLKWAEKAGPNQKKPWRIAGRLSTSRPSKRSRRLRHLVRRSRAAPNSFLGCATAKSPSLPRLRMRFGGRTR